MLEHETLNDQGEFRGICPAILIRVAESRIVMLQLDSTDKFRISAGPVHRPESSCYHTPQTRGRARACGRVGGAPGQSLVGVARGATSAFLSRLDLIDARVKAFACAAGTRSRHMINAFINAGVDVNTVSGWVHGPCAAFHRLVDRAIPKSPERSARSGGLTRTI